jgi:hypothetical protein
MSKSFSRFIAITLISLLGIVAGLVACDESSGPETRTLRGPDISVGAGLARTEIVMDGDEGIRSIAVVFTRDALNNLPATLPNTEFIVPLPSDAPATVFNHIGINWQPQGHPPPMVYTHPHFDTHFYMISMQQRDAMTPADPQFAQKAARAPDAGATPAGYVGDPFGIPRMGTHWTDQNSHEFHGQPFTNTLIFGYYDARLIFLEPMMTKAFLESNPDEAKTIALPAQVPVPGAYPTTYRVRYDNAAAEYRVELLDFVKRN